MQSGSQPGPSGRIAAASGILAVLLSMGGFAMMSSSGLNGDPTLPAPALAEIARSEIGGAARFGLFLDVVGSIFMMIFAVGLWVRLRQAEPAPGGISMLVLAGALLAVAAAAGDKAGFFAMTLRFGHGATGAEAQTLTAIVAGFFWLFRAFSALFTGAAAVATLKTAALPRWTGWFGLFTAVSSLLAAAAPEAGLSQAQFMVFPIWMLIVSISLWRRAPVEVPSGKMIPAV